MRYSLADLYSRIQTLTAMRDHVEKHFTDVEEFKYFSPNSIFDHVKEIPFYPDPEFYEIISRPSYLMDPEIFPGMDCKKKSILIAAWAKNKGLPYAFMAGSEEKGVEPHHVFPIVKIPEKGWIAMDATFPHNRIGEIVTPHEWEIIK